ncbi:MAG TPA: hypothetical protein GXZ87_09520 [Bacteroidales bacterium]|nr:hypothetical protein [Bacteroidales bacterium]
MDLDKTIYSLSVQDLQTVADEELGRELSKEEISLIQEKIGDYIDWQSAISNAINNNLL